MDSRRRRCLATKRALRTCVPSGTSLDRLARPFHSVICGDSRAGHKGSRCERAAMRKNGTLDAVGVEADRKEQRRQRKRVGETYFSLTGSE